MISIEMQLVFFFFLEITAYQLGSDPNDFDL